MTEIIPYKSRNTTLMITSAINEISSVLETIENPVYLVDENVYGLYNHLFQNKNSLIIKIKGGETAKTIEKYHEIISILISKHVSRRSTIIGIGGGTITDLAGFIAATYKRGTDLILVPTTLIGMVDASIGGKNGLNILNFKNQIGTFYQPHMILICDKFLSTLPLTEFKEGLSEVIKSALIADKNLFNTLNRIKLLPTTNDDTLINIIEQTARIKINFTKSDELDSGERQKLNFGHTIGHAIESNSNMSISHGKAVATGMLYELANNDLQKKLVKLYKFQGVEYLSNINMDEIKNLLLVDKKAFGKTITYPTIKSIGVCELSKNTIDSFINRIVGEFNESIW